MIWTKKLSQIVNEDWWSWFASLTQIELGYNQSRIPIHQFCLPLLTSPVVDVVVIAIIPLIWTLRRHMRKLRLDIQVLVIKLLLLLIILHRARTKGHPSRLETHRLAHILNIVVLHRLNRHIFLRRLYHLLNPPSFIGFMVDLAR